MEVVGTIYTSKSCTTTHDLFYHSRNSMAPPEKPNDAIDRTPASVEVGVERFRNTRYVRMAPRVRYLEEFLEEGAMQSSSSSVPGVRGGADGGGAPGGAATARPSGQQLGTSLQPDNFSSRLQQLHGAPETRKERRERIEQELATFVIVSEQAMAAAKQSGEGTREKVLICGAESEEHLGGMIKEAKGLQRIVAEHKRAEEIKEAGRKEKVEVGAVVQIVRRRSRRRVGRRRWR